MTITTDPRLRHAFPLIALVSLNACAPSLATQVASVRSLAGAPVLAALREDHVDAQTERNAAKLLAQPLDADAAVRIALLNNRELRAQLRELGVPAGRLVSASLIDNPTLEIELLPERDSRYELRAEYDLSSLILAPLRRGVAYAELEAARLRVASEVVDLGFEVRTRFYALQATTERLRLSQQALDTLAASRDAVQALASAGNIRQLDAASNIAAYERARAEVAQLELVLAEQRERLQRALGLHGDQTQWQIKEALMDAPERSELDVAAERQALEANLDLQALRKQLEALAKRSGLVRTEGLLPELAADVHALRTKPEEGRTSDAWLWGAGLSVRVPLFDRGQGELQSVEAQFDATLERYHGTAIDVRSAARDARNRLSSAHARALQYQNVILPAQREVMQQTLLQYNAMQLGVFQLLGARRELLNVELAYVDTLRDYWTARAEQDALLQGRVVGASAATPSTITASADAEAGH